MHGTMNIKFKKAKYIENWFGSS